MQDTSEYVWDTFDNKPHHSLGSATSVASASASVMSSAMRPAWWSQRGLSTGPGVFCKSIKPDETLTGITINMKKLNLRLTVLQ